MSYKSWRFLIMTTDPVHVGTGGMRLGRVDNTIVREPGTKLPKIPGTALHGAIRAYAARRYGKPQCAGQGSTEGRRHCGRPTCPICYTFGSIQGEARSFSGVVTITDARILLFPVYSMVGPVWVTSPDALRDAGFNGDYSVSDDKAKWSGLTDGNFLNLGWLMLEREGSWPPPDDLKNKLPEPVKNRIVLVSPNLFSQIVNSNLEVRTSVAINPETGAAEEGALFTYEAIPRATFLWFDVIVDDFRKSLPTTERLENWEEILNRGSEDKKKELLKKWKLWAEKDGDKKLDDAVKKATKWIEGEKFQNDNGDKEWKWEKMKCKGVEAEEKNQKHDEKAILCIIESGLEWAEHLGIGGMGTRGFGRIKKIGDCWEVSDDKIIQIVKKFKNKINKEHGDAKFILFGSFAKNTNDRESDVDVAVIIDGEVDSGVRERIYDIAYEVDLENDVVLDVVIYSKRDWDRLREVHPLIINAEKEGVLI